MGQTLLASTLTVGLLLLPGAAAATTTDGAQVTGTVFLDLDGDGTRGADEPGRANVQVTLRTSATILDATVTDANGAWAFNNVQQGTYTLVIEPPIDHRITGGTVAGLDAAAGEASIDVGPTALDAGTVGLGSPVSSGVDVAATVTRDAASATADRFQWSIAAHNLGTEDADGPVDVRLVLSADHTVTDVTGDGWTCEQSTAIVLCETTAGIPAASSLPALALTTAPAGDPGATVTVTGTVRLEGIFDAAPLNDEDSASLAIGADLAAADIDGDGTGDLTTAGARPTGVLVAALLALVLGATAVRTTTRDRATRP